ncbi:hypothetical protein OOJ09_25980 [Mesorhizobium qingshengii]|uniref:Uncharacterized protein n=1 Tax=Mesorhizobium qingshengii TaxID=1165689 RepID=A0ABT4R1D2_9HYPH|nr:hypothetical protein [Mesorhizobium qingshengii]MCZ8547650.1 hypothetical protein [Mesorhizobium qingshengii]
MNGEPPQIEIAFWLDGELQLSRTCEIERFGFVPDVGDIIADEIHDPLKVRRRVFVPMIGERDIWWLVCDPLPDDAEIESLLVFDKEMRADLKQLEEEARIEEQQETALGLRKLALQRSKRPSHKKMLKEEFGESD